MLIWNWWGIMKMYRFGLCHCPVLLWMQKGTAVGIPCFYANSLDCSLLLLLFCRWVPQSCTYWPRRTEDRKGWSSVSASIFSKGRARYVAVYQTQSIELLILCNMSVLRDSYFYQYRIVMDYIHITFIISIKFGYSSIRCVPYTYSVLSLETRE